MNPMLPSNPSASAARATEALSFDGLHRLKHAASQAPADPATLKAVARQFEALLLQQMLAAMGKTSFGPNLLGETAAPVLQSLYQQQLATTLSQGPGLGLGSFLAKELGVRYGRPNAPVTAPASPAAPSVTPAPVDAPMGGQPAATQPPVRVEPSPPQPPQNSPQPNPPGVPPRAAQATAATGAPSTAAAVNRPATPAAASSDSASAPRDFVASLLPHVERAAQALRVSPVALLAQAALETGWGRHAPGNNLFGIKAAGGETQSIQTLKTTEYTPLGQVVQHAAFRAYQDISDSVEGFTQLLSRSARYAQALGQQSVEAYARAIQRAGYATDPAYAEKLVAIADSPRMKAALGALGRGAWLAKPAVPAGSSERLS